MREILGTVDDGAFAGRRVERLRVPQSDAAKRRLRRRSDDGTDVAIDVPRGTYLADGAVLADDGERVIAVAREPEAALVVRLPVTAPVEDRLRAAALLGHAFGNQHVPVEVDGHELRIPLTTSEEVARATVAALRLPGLAVAVERVALGRQAPLSTAHRHHDGHG